MRVRCIRRYRNDSVGINAQPGDVLDELPAATVGWLLRDGEDCFEVEGETRAPDAPPSDKMIRKPTKAKATIDQGAMTKADHPALLRGE